MAVQCEVCGKKITDNFVIAIGIWNPDSKKFRWVKSKKYKTIEEEISEAYVCRKKCGLAIIQDGQYLIYFDRAEPVNPAILDCWNSAGERTEFYKQP